MNNCTNCILDLTDACTRGAGRAVDDEICESFIPIEVYEVNKNESWQLGYKQGRADAIEDVLQTIHDIYDQDIYCYADYCEKDAKGYSCEDCIYKSIKQSLEQLKEKNNGNFS